MTTTPVFQGHANSSEDAYPDQDDLKNLSLEVKNNYSFGSVLAGRERVCFHIVSNVLVQFELIRRSTP